MKVTDEMVAAVFNGVAHDLQSRDLMLLGPERTRVALTAALADVPEPVPGPFVLSEAECEVMDRWATGCEARLTDYQHFAAALDRAVRTLAAPQVEPLSEEEEWAVRTWECAPDFGQALIAIIRKRFPKPVPAQRTPEELAEVIQLRALSVLDRTANEALAELVRRAK